MPQDLDTESSAIWHLILDSGLADESQLDEIWDEHERTHGHFLYPRAF